VRQFGYLQRLCSWVTNNNFCTCWRPPPTSRGSSHIVVTRYCRYSSVHLFIRLVSTCNTISLLCFTSRETSYDQWHLKYSSTFKSMLTATTSCTLIFNWYTSPCNSAKWPAIALNLTTSQHSPREPVRDTRPCHGVAKGLE